MKRLKSRPINDFDETNSETDFWTDGKSVFYRNNILRGADLHTFEYEGVFSKDEKKCFCGESWLRDADSKTFKSLNHTYAMDEKNVYTITGKVKEADIKSFEVLDDGKSLLWYRNGIPEYTFCGYAKDKNNVYYHNYEGKPKVVRKSDLETFSSLNDGYFAKDKNLVFGNGKVIKKASVASWTKMSTIQNSLYSKDDERVFYGFWEIKVDYETFELEVPPEAKSIDYQLAKDKNNFFRNGEVISEDEFEKYKSESVL